MNVIDSLTLKVEEALMNDPRTCDSPIEVGSYQGIVTLSGWVESAEIAKAAEEIARCQPDVVRVINSLTVDEDYVKELEYRNEAKQDIGFKF
jgi:osmotically-inducible protein OsmY